MHSIRRKRPMNTKKAIVAAVIIGLIALVIILGIRLLKVKVTKEYGNQDGSEIKSEQVAKGSISTTVSGSGILANEESSETTIPQSVEVTDIYVAAGDDVKKGDMLAAVNSTSVVETMSDLQSQIDELDQELDDLDSSTADETLTAGVGGRVKKIYAKEGTSLASTMYASKALLLLSLDGHMAVDIETEELSEDDTVTVVASDGTEYEGSVERVWAGVATILVTDDGTTYDDSVTVSFGDNKTVKGKLYIHEKVAVTGYTGTTATICVAENDQVIEGATLLTLENTDDTVNYQTILKKREALEAELQKLIVIFKEGAVYAKTDGLVTSITENEEDGTATTTAVVNTGSSKSGFGMEDSGLAAVSTTSSEDATDTIIAIAPTDKMSMIVNVDESQILLISVGQATEVTIDSWSEDETFAGTITAIDKVGTSTDGVTTYSATVEIDRTEGMLEGMSASAVITIEGKEDALLVPADAVKKTSSTAYVYTSYDDQTGEFEDMVEVTTGLSNGTYMEITEGLEEGTTVYYKKTSDTSNNFKRGNGFGEMPGGNMPDGNGRNSNRSGGTKSALGNFGTMN